MKILVLTGSFLLLLSMSALQAEVPSSIAVSSADAEKYDYDTSLKYSQSVLDKPVRDFVFTRVDGSQGSFNEFRGKPLVLSMIFTSCYQICPMTTRHLSKVVEKARDALGTDSFEVAVVGFDTSVDDPEAMQYFANKQGIHDKDWNVLSVDEDVVGQLFEDTGFLAYPSPNGFDHLIQTTVIDAEGNVYVQVYGQVFETPILIEPLKELIFGQPRAQQTFLQDLSNKIRLFCTVYDPLRDGYFFDYSLFIGMFIGASIMLMVLIFVIKETRKKKDCNNT